MRRALLFSVLAGALAATAFANSTADFPQSSAFLMLGNNASSPHGILFAGAFGGPVSWTLISLPDGTHHYTLTSSMSRKPSSAFKSDTANGANLEVAINTDKALGSTISNEDSNVVVPELGTLGLLGTGLVGTAGLLRRRKR